jgi:hypothetical protein
LRETRSPKWMIAWTEGWNGWMGGSVFVAPKFVCNNKWFN